MKPKKPHQPLTPHQPPRRGHGVHLVTAVAVVAAGTAVIAYQQFTSSPPTHLAAGEPLPRSSTADIKIVDEATPVTSSDVPIASAATIGEPMPPQPEAAPTPPLAETTVTTPDLNLQFTDTPKTQQAMLINRLGVTLAMLQSTLPATPSQARPLAATALSLARSAEDTETAAALEALLSVMPQNGPPTTGLLLTAALQAVQTPPPPPPPSPKTPKWLSGLVTITPVTSNTHATPLSPEQATTSALNTLLMAGDVAAAIVLLNRPPFNADPRFDEVRTLTDTYMTAHAAFQNALSIYTRSHLTPAE